MNSEHHRGNRAGWLRAAVLGANDGIVSTASLIIGVAAANASRESILLTGFAGLAAGAMSMAAGEFVSVSSQADIEKADLEIEQYALEHHSEAEHAELAEIYVSRGLKPDLAAQVATALMAHDALGSHARDELGIHEHLSAKPIQAAAASASAFAVGAALPLTLVTVTHHANLIPVVSMGSLLFLVLLGSVSARVGGANMWRGAVRVAFWGAMAMAVTAAIGAYFGTAV